MIHHPTESPGTRRRRAVWLLAGGVMLAAWLVLVLQPSSVPEYAGRSLESWLLEGVDPAGTPTDVFGHLHDELWQRLVEAPAEPGRTDSELPDGPVSGLTNRTPEGRERALEALGTNALPLVLRWLVSAPTRGERFKEQLLIQLPGGIRGRLLERGWVTWDAAGQRREAARQAFGILGIRAAPALPALSNLLFHVSPDLTVASAIAETGPAGTQLLIRAVAEGSPATLNAAAYALGLEVAPTPEAGVVLVDAVERGVFSYYVLGSLGRLDSKDPRLTGLLIRRINSGEPLSPFRMEVLLLGLQGTQSAAAVPGLVRRYRESPGPEGASDRRLLRRVLGRISPESEAQLGPRRPDEAGDDWP